MDDRSRHGYIRTRVEEIPTERLPAVPAPSDVSRWPTRPVPAAPGPAPSPAPPAAPAPSPVPSVPPPVVGLLRRLNTRVLSLFVTNPSSGRSLGYVDGLRALAALGVLVYHTRNEALGSTFILPIPFTTAGIDVGPIFASAGSAGVYLFFILSGFLLAQPWIEANYQDKPRPSLKHYFVLRFTRIMPAYYLALLIVILFLTPSLVPAPFIYSWLGLFSVVVHFLFLQFLFPVTSESFLIALPFWSLTIEMLFYLLLPLAVRWFYRRRWLVALPIGMLISLLYLGVFMPRFLPILVPKVVHLAAGMGASWYNTAYASFYVHNQFPAHAFEFALGITLASLYVRKRLGRLAQNRALSWLTGPFVGSCLFMVGCLIILSPMYLISPGMPLIHIPGTDVPKVTWIGGQAQYTLAQYFEVVESIGFALVLAGASYGGRLIRAVLGFTPLRIVGIVSYSIYLLHLPLLHNVIRIYPVAHQSPNELFASYLLTLLAQVLPLAILLYLIVERPFMRLARRRQAQVSIKSHPRF